MPEPYINMFGSAPYLLFTHHLSFSNMCESIVNNHRYDPKVSLPQIVRSLTLAVPCR